MRKNIAASRAPLAGRDHLLVGAIHIHREDLIALQVVARRLKNQPLAVGGKIGLRIRPAKSKLPHIAQMLFLRREPMVTLQASRLSTSHPAASSPAISAEILKFSLEKKCSRRELGREGRKGTGPARAAPAPPEQLFITTPGDAECPRVITLSPDNP